MRFPSRIFSCVLIASLFAAGAEAGENRWTPIGVGAGFVQSLAVDPDTAGVVWAAAGAAGIYRSTDGARTWQWRGAATETLENWTDVAVAPTDSRRLYATSGSIQTIVGGVYTSGDGGLHWQRLLRHGAGFTSVAVSANGSLLVAQPAGEIQRSGDGGRTWSVVLRLENGIGRPARELAFDPLAPEVAYAGSLTGLWRSTDSGATWQRIGTLPGGSQVLSVEALAFPGTRPGFLYGLLSGRLYRSEDGGLTWSGGAQVGSASGLAVDPQDSRTVYVSGFVIFVSHDGGETAVELARFPAIEIAVSPAAPSLLYASYAFRGVAVSTDGGEHWTLSEQRGLSASDNETGFFYAAPSGRLYHEPYGDGQLFRSLDRGGSWSPLAPLATVLLFALTEEPGSPDHLWAIATGTLYHSTDGGASWSASSLSGYMNTVVSPSPGVVLAGGCGIFRSDDDGRTWTEALSCVVGTGGGLAERQVARLGVPHGWPGAVWAEIAQVGPGGILSQPILWSRTSGRTWRTLARRVAALGLGEKIAASRGVIYIVRHRALQRSSDLGASWETAPVGVDVLSVAVDAADPDIVYVATARRGVLRSADGGATWVDANAGLARLGRLWILDVTTDPAFPGVVYAFPLKGGIFQARFED